MDYKLRIDRIGLLQYIIHIDPVFKTKGDSAGFCVRLMDLRSVF